jgi:hypothetical protein
MDFDREIKRMNSKGKALAKRKKKDRKKRKKKSE